jgi:hypothetical protein
LWGAAYAVESKCCHPVAVAELVDDNDDDDEEEARMLAATTRRASAANRRDTRKSSDIARAHPGGGHARAETAFCRENENEEEEEEEEEEGRPLR